MHTNRGMHSLNGNVARVNFASTPLQRAAEIALYRSRVRERAEIVPSVVEVWYARDQNPYPNIAVNLTQEELENKYMDFEGGVTLECYRINQGAGITPTGFTTSGFDDEGNRTFQYSPFARAFGKVRSYTANFMDRPEWWTLNQGGKTVSHLCHNNWCHNWEHHVYETLPVNKGRNGCPGGPHCHHVYKCMIPGPYYNQ